MDATVCSNWVEVAAVIVVVNEEPEIGRTGARFGGPSRRRSQSVRSGDAHPAGPVAEEPVAIEIVPPAADPGGPEVGLTGARFGGGARRRRRPEEIPPPAAPAAVTPAVPPLPGVEPEHDEVVGPSVTVRPYVLTGGRTRSRLDLAVETMVSAAPRAVVMVEAAEHLAVIALCQQVRAVAEISALLHVPLGVARVLVSDLEAMGAVFVHKGHEAIPDILILQRILAGLRRL